MTPCVLPQVPQGIAAMHARRAAQRALQQLVLTNSHCQSAAPRPSAASLWLCGGAGAAPCSRALAPARQAGQHYLAWGAARGLATSAAPAPVKAAEGYWRALSLLGAHGSHLGARCGASCCAVLATSSIRVWGRWGACSAHSCTRLLLQLGAASVDPTPHRRCQRARPAVQAASADAARATPGQARAPDPCEGLHRRRGGPGRVGRHPAAARARARGASGRRGRR